MESAEKHELGIKEFLEVAARRWRLIVYAMLLGFVIAAAYALLRPPSYRAVAVVQVEEEKPRYILNPERQSDLPPLVGVEAEIEIVRSRLVLEPVIRELGLETTVLEGGEGVRVQFKEFSPQDPTSTYEYTIKLAKDGKHYKAFDAGGAELGAGALGQTLQSPTVRWVLDITGAKPGSVLRIEVAPFETALENLRESLFVEEVAKQTNIISIAADMPDPQLAKQVTERITQAYLAQNVSRKSQEVGQILNLIEQQLLVVKGDMERDEKELNDLKSAKGVFVLSEEAKRIIEQISKMEMSRAETQLAYKQVQDLARRLRNAKDASTFLLGEASIQDELITELSRELTKRLVELRNLRQDFTLQNPRVMALNAEIDELKQKIDAALNNVARTLKSKMDTSERLIAKYETQLRGLPQAERELAALTRKTNVTGELYSFLLKKHEEMRIAQAGIVGNLRVVEHPVLPLKPVAPKKTRVALLGLLAGLVIGIGLTFVAEALDDTVSGAERVERAFGMAIFGEIPEVPKLSSNEPGLLPGSPEQKLLEESFNTLATNLRFAGRHRELKRILCVSTDTGEGKTTCIVNLGVTLANRGARVLLIDCDLRRPGLHGALGLRDQPGLTQAIVSGNSWREAVIPARRPRLALLPAGPVPPNQAELLDGEAFQTIVSEAGAEYDYVLIDVPPVLAFTDAAIVSTHVDAVFMVVAAGRTRGPNLSRALAMLKNVRAPVRGAIVNFAMRNADAANHYYQVEKPATLWDKVKAVREWLVRA